MTKDNARSRTFFVTFLDRLSVSISDGRMLSNCRASRSPPPPAGMSLLTFPAAFPSTAAAQTIVSAAALLSLDKDDWKEGREGGRMNEGRIPKARQRKRGWRTDQLFARQDDFYHGSASILCALRRSVEARDRAIMRRLPSPDLFTRFKDDLTNRCFRLSPRFHSGGGMWNSREEAVASLRLTIDSFITCEGRTRV